MPWYRCCPCRLKATMLPVHLLSALDQHQNFRNIAAVLGGATVPAKPEGAVIYNFVLAVDGVVFTGNVIQDKFFDECL
jgi:hypothetical protein